MSGIFIYITPSLKTELLFDLMGLFKNLYKKLSILYIYTIQEYHTRKSPDIVGLVTVDKSAISAVALSILADRANI